MSLPKVSAKTFSLSAIIVGYLLIDDLTANEQNALGNWLMLAAQVLSTNAFYKQVQQEHSEKTVGVISNEDGIAMLQKMVDALNKEIEQLKSTH